MRNINKYLELVKSAQDGIDTLFSDSDINSLYGARGRKITLDRILHRPHSLPVLHSDYSQRQRVVIFLWDFGGMDMWGTAQIKDKRERWSQFIHFAEHGRIVHLKPGEEMTLAKIFRLPDCVVAPELTIGINGQLAVILLLI